MAVNPSPKAPKQKKSKKPKGFSTDELMNYLRTGGSLTDISGNKISQGQVLQALSNPATLGLVINNLAANFGQTGTYNPNIQYGSGIPSFDASYNPVKDKYSNLEGVQAQIVNDLFESIDSGVEPAIASAKLLDENFLKSNYGVSSSQIGNLGSTLMADAEEYKKAEAKRKSAMQEQNYEAWRKGVTEQGATPSEYLSKALGIPALRNLPDPTQGYTASAEELALSPQAMGVLAKSDPRLANLSPYKPSAAVEAAARRYASGYRATEGRPDQITTDINKAFGIGEFAGTRDYIPESILGQKQWGTRAVNEAIGNILGGVVKGAGALFTMGGYNPFQGTKSKKELEEADKAVRQQAYEKFVKSTPEARMADMSAKRREEILNIASRLITERGQELAAQGVTPFTAGLGQISKVLAGTNIPIVKRQS